MPYENYINLLEDEIDKPVYRIMPVTRLLQCLEEKELVLVPPSKWDDPFENWLLSSKVKIVSTGESGDLEGIRKKIYGQCWTQHNETDAMWRIYSSDANGAKVKTTPRKLLEALKRSDQQFGNVTCFIGKVQYQNQKNLAASLMNIDIFKTNGAGVAESLLYKRSEFRHEKEVRLIFIEGNEPVYPFTISPNDLIDEIVFDPRVDKNLYQAYEAAVVAKGFTGKVSQSTLYRPPSALFIKM